MSELDRVRSSSFGQGGALSFVDRVGVWLSERQLRGQIGSWKGKDVGDFGCGYDATLIRHLLPDLASATVCDVAVAPGLNTIPKVEVLEGPLPEIMAKLQSESLDIVLCVSVLEHLWEPDLAVNEFYRLLRPGGFCFINVPTWRGKQFLEFSAFKLGFSPVEEMNDHKRYYDPKDLWPLLIRAGFLPSDIKCGRYKLGLNCFAACRKRIED